MGKTRIIAETGAGQHGVAVATVCARFGLPCEIFMGATDVERQKPNVFRMKLLGAKVDPVTVGAGTLKDAMNEALRDWVTNVRDTYYIIGTAAGPHPYPAMVRDFQSIIGKEVREQMHGAGGPAARHARRLHRRRLERHRACSIRSSTTRASRSTASKPAATGSRSPNGHAASMNGGRPGVLHGNRTYLLQDADGQILEGHSISAGLDYPGVGPEHAWLKDTGRVNYVSATDKEALEAFQLCTRARGHHSGARAGARARLRHQAGADAAKGQPAGDEHVRPRRQGHFRRRRPPRHENLTLHLPPYAKSTSHDPRDAHRSPLRQAEA